MHAPVRIAPEVPEDTIEEDIPDVPIADPEGVQEADLTLSYRRMSRRALIEESASEAHSKTHYPQNPFCDVCVESNQLQIRFARTGERKDDGLDAVIEPLESIIRSSCYMSR